MINLLDYLTAEEIKDLGDFINVFGRGNLGGHIIDPEKDERATRFLNFLRDVLHETSTD